MSRNPPLKVTEKQKMSRITKKVKICWQKIVYSTNNKSKKCKILKKWYQFWKCAWFFRQISTNILDFKQENHAIFGFWRTYCRFWGLLSRLRKFFCNEYRLLSIFPNVTRFVTENCPKSLNLSLVTEAKNLSRTALKKP